MKMKNTTMSMDMDLKGSWVFFSLICFKRLPLCPIKKKGYLCAYNLKVN